MITLFTRADDPRCHRVRIVLAEKAVEVRLIEVDPAEPHEDLIDLNPYQSLPTLVDRDLVVYDPGVINEYLDERLPHPPLMPADPSTRAQARLVMRRIEQEWYAAADDLDADDRRMRDRGRKMLTESLLVTESLFRARTWFLSETFSLVDAAVAPILWRLGRWGIETAERLPALERYASRAFARPAFRASLSDAERSMRVSA